MSVSACTHTHITCCRARRENWSFSAVSLFCGTWSSSGAPSWARMGAPVFTAVGEPHHHRPAVIQSSGLSSVPRMRVPRFLWANLQTAGVVSGGECRVPQPGDVARWRSGLLEQSYVRVHPQKLAPRLASRRDVPTHYCYGQCILRSFVRILPHVLCGSLPAGTGQMLLVVLVREVGDDVKMV